MKRAFYLFLMSLSIVHICLAQEQYTFTNLNEKDGLQNNIIFSMLKDSHGILWIGTQNGLNRFDGVHFYTFKKTREANSLPNNSIQSLCEDNLGNIWGGTDNGIFRFSPSHNKFTSFLAPSTAHSNIVSNIICDKQGDVYAATSIDILKFDKKKQVFQLLTKLTNDADSIEIYFLGKNRVVNDDANNGLWIATKNGLLFYDKQQNKILNSKNRPNLPLFAIRNTSAITKAANGKFWCFDNHVKEAISFDPKTKKIVQRINISELIPNSRVSTLMEDREHRLWVCSWSYELFTIDLTNQNKISQVKSVEGMSNTVAANFFWSALEDENGTIYLGTTNGISMCNPGKYVYKARHLPDKINELKSCAIYTVEEDPIDKSWWIATTNRLLIHYYPSTEKSTVYNLENSKPNFKGALPSNIQNIRFFDKKVMACTSTGVWQLNVESKRFIPFSISSSDVIAFAFIDFLLQDSLIHLADYTRLYSYNLITKKGKWAKEGLVPPNTKFVFGYQHLLWKPNHKFYWTLAGDYIATLDKEANPVLTYMLKDNAKEAGGYFHAADMDKEGNIWIANKGVGLYRYSPTTSKIKYWTELDGLVDNHLHAIKADNDGSIWYLYFNRAGVFNPKENSFTNFYIPYSENNLNYFNNLTKRSDGVIMGNIANDVFEFFPKNIKIKPVIESPLLSVLSISGKDYFIDDDNKLTLEPNQNSLRFKFGMLLNPFLFPYEIEYKLHGSDQNWVRASVTNEANYNNLAPGSYTFHVIAKGINNAWHSDEKTIQIEIKTPFYKSSWFLFLIFAALASLLFWFYKYRLTQQRQMFQLKSKAQLLEKEKSMVMYESLKQQLNPHFLFNSLTSLSGLIDTDQELAGTFLEQMSGIYRYILKNGDNETVTLKDEISFVKLYVSLQQTRFKQGLKVNINVPDEYLHYKIAPVTLQNLIENAIKHNVIDAEVPLVVDIYIDEEYIVVKNNLHKKNKVETSNKKGLIQFESLYRYLSDKPIIIEESTEYYTIKIPLI